MRDSSTFQTGDWVVVRSKKEILRTLDKKGQLEGMPFMPQMFQYCGRRVRVSKRAHKCCDTAFNTGARKLENAVHLEGLRCDGVAFGGCQAVCLLYWKDEWLKPATPEEGSDPSKPQPTPRPSGETCTEAEVYAGTKRGVSGENEETVYVCQATQLPLITKPLPTWDLRQYFEDLRSRNVRLSQMLYPFFFSVYHNIATAGFGFGSALRFCYDRVQKLRGGMPYPWRKAKIPRGGRTPSATLNLQPGDVVRVKNYENILETIDEDYLNRGMQFHAELVPYCGQTRRVTDRLERIVNEKTGRLMTLKNPCIILEGTECDGCYGKPLFCPRGCFAYWREVWLERAAVPRQKSALLSPPPVDQQPPALEA